MALELKISGLKKSYDSKNIVLDLAELSVEPGEIFFLLGSSGCGKSTLLRILAGLLKPDAGSILFNGENVTNFSAEKRKCAMVFQNYALWPHLTVGENIAFGLEVAHKTRVETRKTVSEMLALVHLSGFDNRRIASLSGGQQQRVALARALAINPSLLLLDEPLSNLDAQLRDEMRLEIRQLIKEQGLSAIYVTHDRREALSIADRIGIMNAGSLVEIGTPRELYRHPKTEFTARFLGHDNLIAGVVKSSNINSCQVVTSIGTLEVANPHQEIAPGDQVTVLIRPETIKPETGTNNIPVQLVESSFVGEHTEVLLKSGEVRLRANLKDDSNLDELKFISIDPFDAVLIK